MVDIAKPARVGILFVHGIGEQKRFEHLRSSVLELAELLKQPPGRGHAEKAVLLDRAGRARNAPSAPSSEFPPPDDRIAATVSDNVPPPDPPEKPLTEEEVRDELKRLAARFASGSPACMARVSVVDRTDDWKYGPTERHPRGLAPITLNYRTEERWIAFECHEVWWSDLGTRSGLGDVIRFWFWGLGQWCAPIYREMDAARLEKVDRRAAQTAPKDEEAPPDPAQTVGPEFDKPVSMMATLPASVAGNFRLETAARFQLWLAALAALFVACTWSLAKRLFANLLKTAPSPTLLVQYVGDVRLYESRAVPGDSPITDPGHPRRVAIRRRMVQQMVGMATAGYDGWYVSSHSLGTIVAYNGLTETGHALPNYLTKAQWDALPRDLKVDYGVARRRDIHKMMPSRPAWLKKGEVINRVLLFKGLRGFLTYGSPLDKFAGLWPRIVATATDRLDKGKPFENTRWLNLVAPADPVAGTLESFDDIRFDGGLTPVNNRRAPATSQFGLAHITYFTNAERYSDAFAIEQRRQVAQWFVDEDTPVSDCPYEEDQRNFTGFAYAMIVAALAALTIVVAALVVMGVRAALRPGGKEVADGAGRETSAPDAMTFLNDLVNATVNFVSELLHQSVALAHPTVAVALSLLLVSGLLRWWRETSLNQKLMEKDAKDDSFAQQWTWPDYRRPDARSDNQVEAHAGYWADLRGMLDWHATCCFFCLTYTAVLLPWAVAVDWAGWWAPLDMLRGAYTWIVALLMMGLAILLQTWANRASPPAKLVEAGATVQAGAAPAEASTEAVAAAG